MQNNITGTIITFNEEKHIEAVIHSLQEVCNEIVVVDSFSTDRTVEMAEALGAKVIQHSFLGDGPQRVLAEPLCSNDWVLSLDADERLEDDAVKAILALQLAESEYDAYSFRRNTYIGKKFIRQWYPDKVIRLYDRTKCTFPNDREHGGDVKTENYTELEAHLTHYSFPDFATLVRKADRFAVNLAEIRYAEGKRASWYDPFLHGFGAFTKGMIMKGGILGGIQEWHVAFASAYNSYMKYVIMLELQENAHDEK